MSTAHPSLHVFGIATLNCLFEKVLAGLKGPTDPAENNQLTDDEFMVITRTINKSDANSKSIREIKRNLLSSLSARMTGNKAGVVEGTANLKRLTVCQSDSNVP